MRLDNKLVSLSLVTSRSQGLDLIKRGYVYVNHVCILKPALEVFDHDVIDIKKDIMYVSRGADKLNGFIRTISLPWHTMHAIDIGASTGGFTQVLLHHDIVSVETFDVGYQQLDISLRNHPKITVHEEMNILNYPLTQKDLAVIDVSFTSVIPILTYIKPYITHIIVLVKPQFEQLDAFKDVIRHPKEIERIMSRVTQTIKDLGYHIKRIEASALTGKKGNQEFFMYLTQ
jgi:23S rRNA (cytidine1920-2'-O)/16S rRNA (cytidine1409-2'-O)-methyltransferase